MYVTLSPCPDCAKAITQSGIKQLVYCENYDRNEPGWEKILEEAGIKVFQIQKNKLNTLNWDVVRNYCSE